MGRNRRNENNGFDESLEMDLAIDEAVELEKRFHKNSRDNVMSIISNSDNPKEERRRVLEKTGLSQSHLSQILNGDGKYFTLPHLYLISKLYNRSIESLILDP